MKKIYLFLVVVALGISCSEETPFTGGEEIVAAMPEQRSCASYEVLQEEIRKDPARGKRLEEIEAFTQKVISNPNLLRTLADGTIEIDVNVNVLWNTSAQNISDQQIVSQIAVLNEDFAALNSDYNKTSTYNNIKSGDIKIKFVLKNTFRKQTSITAFSTNNDVKISARGGLDPTNPTTTLNMWSCNLSGGVLGYAQFPGGNSSTDGVVILYNAFGSRAKFSGGTYTTTYDLGRTATHEVGHWLNLRHIWGDARCGNDQVNDTPQHDAANYNCPAAGTLSRCKGQPVEMTMNYMDYTADACMYMFTQGQGARMKAVFVAGGPRAGIATQQ
jgi:hypothetical protein